MKREPTVLQVEINNLRAELKAKDEGIKIQKGAIITLAKRIAELEKELKEAMLLCGKSEVFDCDGTMPECANKNTEHCLSCSNYYDSLFEDKENAK